MKKTILILALFTLSFAACKKSEDAAPTCTLSSTTITGTYKVTSIIYKATPSSAGVDFIDTVLPQNCQKDDNIIISTGATLIYSDLNTKCVPEGTLTGSWSLLGSTFTVIGTGTGLDGKSQVIENFNCGGFEGTYTLGLVSGDKVVIKYQKL